MSERLEERYKSDNTKQNSNNKISNLSDRNKALESNNHWEKDDA